MSKLAIAKLAVQAVTSLGVSKVIMDIIKNNANVETAADSVRVAAGSLVLGSMIVEHASDHVSTQFDKVLAWHTERQTAETSTE
jgi:hypothetical protein